MDTGVIVAIIVGATGLIGSIVGGVITYKLGRRNAEDTRKVEEERLSTASWQSQVENWRQDVVELRRQRAEDSEKHAKQRAEDAAERDKLRSECTDQIGEMRLRLDEVTRSYAENRRQQRLLEERNDALVYWGLQVIRIMIMHGVVFPPPPDSIRDLMPVNPDDQEL